MMNNRYYNPYAQSYCRMSENGCSRNIGQRETAHMSNCACERRIDSPIPENAVVTMAYVPFQEKWEVYDCMQALRCGTLFPELNKPFTGCCRYE